MDQPTKKQKVGDSISIYKEEVLFNSDTLSKVISFLPSTDLLNLALTCKWFGISSEDGKLFLIEESTRIAIQDIATEEELATLPYYNGQNSLANYHYLQFMRGPLTFDQLAVGAEYVNSGDKSRVMHRGSDDWGTAFSNNILRAGKHYAAFNTRRGNFFVGVMRPGQVNQNARGIPVDRNFFQHFSPSVEYNNNSDDVQCCVYRTLVGCISSNWRDSDTYTTPVIENWDRSALQGAGNEIGMLLDLDEGTLTGYKNGRKLGVKNGLAGEYCWVVSLYNGTQVTIKRGTIPRG